MRVSRDGRWLLYDSDLRGNSDIYRIPVNGGQPEQLTDDPADEFAPDLSPGRPCHRLSLLAHRHARHRGQAARRRARRAGHRDAGAGELPSLVARWSGDRVLQSGAAVFTCSSRGEKAAVVGPPPRCIGSQDRGRFLVSGWTFPRLCRGRNRPAARCASWSYRPRAAARAACSIPTPTAPPAEQAEWSPDGRTLYYKAHDAQGRASFWAVNAAGGRPRVLVRFNDLTGRLRAGTSRPTGSVSTLPSRTGRATCSSPI